MKKEISNNKKQIDKLSFQSQLFFIVLVVFVLFILLEYIIVEYILNYQYTNAKIEQSQTAITELKSNINDGDLLSSLSEYTQESGNKCVVLSSLGGLHVKESVYTTYKIVVSKSNTDYTLVVSDYDCILNVGDRVNYIYYEVVDDLLIARSIYINNKEYIGEPKSTYLKIENLTITKIERPSNLNFEYIKNNNTLNAIQVAIQNINKFEEKKLTSTKYYIDKENSNLYFIIDSNKENEYILIITNSIETESLSNTISTYYGYIALGSVILTVLIGFFISKAFSKPIKKIEKEMNNLASGEFEPSNYGFNNSELDSLENTLNQVKEETKERVTKLESQKNELTKMNSRILHEEDLRKSFIARLSHELKTPLMVIGSTTEAMMDGIIKDEDKEKEFQTILNEIEKSNTIIKDIIKTYKSSSSEKELNIERFNLEDLLLNVVESLKTLSTSLKVNVKTTKVFISADYNLIGQVISNFITNAYKYTLDSGSVDINLIDSNKTITLEVINYPAHIDEKNLDKIWLPFYREKEDVDSISTGMGLYIVKEILEAHNFKFNVENTKNGVRSYFIITKENK